MNLSDFEDLKSFIEASERVGLLHEAKDVSGLSGNKLVGALQRLAKYQCDNDAGCYLEIGVFQGMTLVSTALALNTTVAYGIDNFSQFDPQGMNQDIVNRRIAANELGNVSLINEDYEDALEGLSRHLGSSKIGLYFVDGPHDYRSQLMCLGLAKPYLSDRAVIIVDDCNYRHVRQANRDFLVTNPEFKLFFEAYTDSHPLNMSQSDEQLARSGWWNGVNIIVRDPQDALAMMLPPTARDRTLYENEHLVHAAQYGLFAPEAVKLVSHLRPLRPLRLLWNLLRMRRAMRTEDSLLTGTFRHMNTFSKNLSPGSFNRALA